MARRDDRVTLQQMLDNTNKALILAEGRSRADLDADWIATLAMMQLLQIIGEAARRLSDGFREQHPEIPWTQIIGQRNRLIHGYDAVDLDRLWLVMTADVPKLAADLAHPRVAEVTVAATIDQLIINVPYEEPERHWRYDRESRTFSLEAGRRPAGYVIATPGSKSFDDPGVFKELPLVNRIRTRVKAWRDAGYPGVTGTTLRLLQHWRDPDTWQERRFFFCQLEAIETLIWLTEAPAGERQGIDIPGDGGPFSRLCAKMATGSGKTLVMAMAIAWHILNRVANPQDARFSKNVLVVAPGLTVRKRLAVLEPSDPGNYYDRFNMVPSALRERLRQGKVLVRNWHALNWESDEQLARKRGVDKRGARSDAAYVKDVLGDMASASNLLVVNDEAHHAWRVPAQATLRRVAKADIEEATRWVGGLDRIHRSRGILGCYDFSATPFVPSGKESTEEALFGWVVSDFSLNDAIESGLVKTPRVVVRDDGVPGTRAAPGRTRSIPTSIDACSTARGRPARRSLSTVTRT